ncbi:peptide chain release factor N(5)-glutamine methyltransferase [Thiomicrorhabdus indica]|uniref:peptide chain release factor N(5)-glutamine methyltransferase n=1 Tax=Thiomicrorhabdus indica TaxID=2267253 RepID=UPI00102D7B94|nr:peptide chain release factor N(5)-glutamine methyltransferase [Thiomicrorhabdus indica]
MDSSVTATTQGYTIEQVIQLATDALFGLSDSPKLDAELLLCHVLECERSYLYTWPEKILGNDQVLAFRELLQKRQQGHPIAHLIGEREFWGLPLKVTPDTLIPRPDTEVLIETALTLLPAGQNTNLRILDLGTGTGAIALALKSERPNAQVSAVDFSEDALNIAKINSQNLNLPIQTLHSSWFQSLPAGEYFDLIASNPPYIEENDKHLTQGDVRFEPITALTSGVDGLEDIRLITKQSIDYLLPDGWLILEHGYNQGEAVREILAENGYQTVETRQDYGGNDRVTFGQKNVT